MPYHDGNLKLELLLSEPGSVEALFSQIGTEHGEYRNLRSVVSYAITLQIAGTYAYNPKSSFLLVVNSQTANTVIHQIIRFIEHELRLWLDIFNLSVGGSLENSATGKSVLEDYQGKGIIIFPNMFPYFGRGHISAFDLLDPCVVSRIARAGTNFLLAGPKQNLDPASTWASMLAPMVDSTHAGSTELPTTGTQPAASLKEFSTKLYAAGAPKLEPLPPKHERKVERYVAFNAAQWRDRSRAISRRILTVGPAGRRRVRDHGLHLHGSGLLRAGDSARRRGPALAIRRERVSA